MKRNLIWGAIAVALVVIPAVVGLVVVQGDAGSRRAAALVDDKGTVGYRLTLAPVTPAGKAIDVLSYSWGVKGGGAAPSAGTTTATAPKFTGLTIVKKVDQTSAPLVKAATAGTKHPSAVLTLSRMGNSGVPYEYFKYTLTNVVVSSVDHSGGGGDVPTESFELAYSAVKLETNTPTEEKAAEPPTVFSYDLATGKG